MIFQNEVLMMMTARTSLTNNSKLLQKLVQKHSGDTNIVQKLFQLTGVAKIEILIESITIDLDDLPRYNAPEDPNNDFDVLIDKEE